MISRIPRRRSTPGRAAKTTEQSAIGDDGIRNGALSLFSPSSTPTLSFSGVLAGAGFPAKSSPKSFSIFNSMNTRRATFPLLDDPPRIPHRYGSLCLARQTYQPRGGPARIEKWPIPLKVEANSRGPARSSSTSRRSRKIKSAARTELFRPCREERADRRSEANPKANSRHYDSFPPPFPRSRRADFSIFLALPVLTPRSAKPLRSQSSKSPVL